MRSLPLALATLLASAAAARAAPPIASPAAARAAPPTWRRVLEPMRFSAGWTPPLYLADGVPFHPSQRRLGVYADQVDGRARYGFQASSAEVVTVTLYPTTMPPAATMADGSLPTEPAGPAIWSRTFHARADVLAAWRSERDAQLADPKRILETGIRSSDRVDDRVLDTYGWAALGLGMRRYGSVRHGVPAHNHTFVHDPRIHSWQPETYRVSADGTQEWGSDEAGWRPHPWAAAMPTYQMSADHWLPEVRAGSYVLVARSDDLEHRAPFLWSRLKVLVQREARRLEVLVLDGDDELAKGAEVTGMAIPPHEGPPGELPPPVAAVAEDGVAELALPWLPERGGARLLVRHGDDFALLSTSTCDLRLVRSPRHHVIFERTWLRPGEAARYRAQFLAPRPGGGWDPVDSVGRIQGEYRPDVRVQTDDSGVASEALPSDLAPSLRELPTPRGACGWSSPRAPVPPALRRERAVFVSDPQFQDAHVELTPTRAVLLQGTAATFQVRAATGAGDPLALQEVGWSVYRGGGYEDQENLRRFLLNTLPPGEWSGAFALEAASPTSRQGRLRLDEQGRAELPIGVATDEGWLGMRVMTWFKDQGGHLRRAEASVFAPPADRFLALESSRAWVAHGTPWTGRVAVRDLRGEAVAGPVVLELGRYVEEDRGRGYRERVVHPIRTWQVTADATGLAPFTIEVPSELSLPVLTARVADRSGARAAVRLSVPHQYRGPPGASPSLALIPDDRVAPQEVLVQLQGPRRTFYWWVDGDGHPGFHRVEATTGDAAIRFPARGDPDLMDQLRVVAPLRWGVLDARQNRPPLGDPGLVVTLDPSTEHMAAPGTPVTWEVRVTDAQGRPWSGPLAATVRDEPDPMPVAGVGPLPPEPASGGNRSAFWDPHLQADAQGHATLHFEVPAGPARWRVRVDAVATDGRMGTASAVLHVREATRRGE